MKTRLSTLAVILAFGGIRLFADCATTPWPSDNTNGTYTTMCPKVGIGTAVPAHKLHILENVDANTFLVVENTNSNGLSSGGFLRAKSDTATVNFQAHGSARTISRFGVALGGWNEFLGVTGNGLAIGTNVGAGPLILGTASTARMNILADGKIGVGTASPAELLHVFENVDTQTFLEVENPNTGVNANATLRAKADVAKVNFQAHGSARTISRFGVTLGAWNEFLAVTGNGLIVGTAGASPLILGTGGAARMNILADGKIGIGMTAPSEILDVAGNIHATGSISANGALYAKFQDIAEWVPATTDLVPGTVVILNPERSNEVMASTGVYDTTVAGVVSTQPGLNLGEPGRGKEAIATTGRVKVRVSVTSEPIRIGDLLVTSDIPGTAMRSEPMNINGRKFHQPGTIIGKALEPWDAGQGEILVLLSMQ